MYTRTTCVYVYVYELCVLQVYLLKRSCNTCMHTTTHIANTYISSEDGTPNPRTLHRAPPPPPPFLSAHPLPVAT
jgi:hypothetical protein